MILLLVEQAAELLQQIVVGFASLRSREADDSSDVMLRIMTDSNYQPRCPKLHVDQVDVRGLLALDGPGTEFQLAADRNDETDLCTAGDLSVVLLRGTQWPHGPGDDGGPPFPLFRALSDVVRSSLGMESEFQACWHRSPPPPLSSAEEPCRRVLLSFDFAEDGEEEREWCAFPSRSRVADESGPGGDFDGG